MKKLVLLVLLTTNLAFASEGGHKGHSSSKKVQVHSSENEEFNNVLKKYEVLHQAFFDNDKAKVKSQAAAVSKAIKGIKREEIQKNLNYSLKKLESIKSNDDLEASKKDFNTVSQALLVVLEKQAGNKNYARYYCPMVKKYWIQNVSKSEKVMNPYASSTMPHCGSKK